jgi:2-hydroxy-6-oxonona-2,4-dienedioate hydrolase
MTNIEAHIRALESTSTLSTALCGDGTMPFRTWHPLDDGQGRELIVMMHGGSGSWTHWYRNISALSDNYELVIPDLPALGDAASLPKGTEPQGVADIVAEGLRQVLGFRRFHLIAFSWGSVVASLAAPQLASQVKSILLIGPASMGKMPKPMTMKRLMPRTEEMSVEEVSEVNRENLARLMFYDRKKIDATALTLQNINTAKARYNSPKYSQGDYLLAGLKNTTAKLLVIYGGEDAVAIPNLEEREARLKAVRPDANFEVRQDVGHWLQYEDANWFNGRVVEWIESNIVA